MEKLPYVKSFRDLVVYQKSRQLAQDVFMVSKSFPVEEKYSLTDQIRRSSRSIGAQIAEAWAKRRYERHFVSKLTDADGEQQETQHWIEVASDCGYINTDTIQRLKSCCSSVGQLLGAMMNKPEAFCKGDSFQLKEEAGIYIITASEGIEY